MINRHMAADLVAAGPRRPVVTHLIAGFGVLLGSQVVVVLSVGALSHLQQDPPTLLERALVCGGRYSRVRAGMGRFQASLAC